MPNFALRDPSGLCCFIGHLGKDPVLTQTTNGKKMAKFTLATNRKDQAGNITTDWHSCVCWEEQADAAMKLRKGQVGCVVGKESSREYNGKTFVDINCWYVGVEALPWNPGQHESLPKLPGPSSNQPAPAESGDEQIPF
jgi:single-strand DNA-binding protein